MDTENFLEIVKRLKLESVEIEVLDKNNCLVVDLHIPREWFRQHPGVVIWPSHLPRVMAEHPEKFSLPVAASESP